jgi:hypothetical protein
MYQNGIQQKEVQVERESSMSTFEKRVANEQFYGIEQNACNWHDDWRKQNENNQE